MTEDDSSENQVGPGVPTTLTPRHAPTRKRRRRKGTFEVGMVFGTSLAVWGKNLVAVVLLALIVFIPYAGFLLWVREGPDLDREFWEGTPDTLISHVSKMLVAAPVVGAVFAQLRGRRESFGSTIGSGLARIPAVLGVALLQAVIYVICFVPAMIADATDIPALGLILGLLSWIALVIVSCGLYVAVPAAVVERPGIFEALERSWHLTNGNKARIFLISVLFGLVSVAPMIALLGVGTIWVGEEFSWAFSWIVTAVLASIEAVFMAVIYHDLRVAVDGVDTEEIAAVFD